MTSKQAAHTMSDANWSFLYHFSIPQEEIETLVKAIFMGVRSLDQQSATLALLHDLRRYLHDSTGSSLELDTRREKLHGRVVDRIREMEGEVNAKQG